MKKVCLILLIVSSSYAFAQQSPNPFLSNNIFNYKLESADTSKQSLNMDFFKLDDLKKNTDALTKFLRESNSRREKAMDNMPIFVPNGKFFLEIYKVDDDIDYKLRIFDLENQSAF